MNPRDHPHGGGEGKSPVGRKTPVSKWGKPAHGAKTRTKQSDKLIVRRRGSNVSQRTMRNAQPVGGIASGAFTKEGPVCGAETP